MSTWVECLEDSSWVNLAHVGAVTVWREEAGAGWEVRFQVTDGLFLHSRHDSETAARQAAERILAAAGERCLRQGI